MSQRASYNFRGPREIGETRISSIYRDFLKDEETEHNGV